MDVSEIPFAKVVGIVSGTSGNLELPFSERVQNHLQTIHASAQFTLAESASGKELQEQFPELVGKVVPLLRGSQIKFRKPATQTIIAHPSVAQEAVERFRAHLSKRGRASISVQVEVRDREGTVTSTGVFDWFVQALDPQ